jgi:predicted Rossmann fold nucleotide-binding protein DprA/Smf involved in DNA uptake
MNSTKQWIALEQTHGIGPAHLREIHEALTAAKLSLSDVCDLTIEEISNEFSFQPRIAEALAGVPSILPKIEEDYFKLLESGIDVITFFSEQYPQRLHDTLGQALPPILYSYGNARILKQKGVAILGDKDVSDKGEMISYAAARELSKHDIPVVSGYARGADLIAHRSSLVNGCRTVAMVPYGIFHLSVPDMLRDTMDMERLVVVSPFYPTREPNRFNAYIRNKIICALSYAVYIVEAPEEGGIFEAAKSAHNLKIPLFTTEYAEFPKNATGNRKIIDELDGIPVLGRMENELLVPNMDKIIGAVKFG